MQSNCETVDDSGLASDHIYIRSLRYLHLVQNSKPLELSSFRLLDHLSRHGSVKHRQDNVDLKSHKKLYLARQRLSAWRILQKLWIGATMLRQLLIKLRLLAALHRQSADFDDSWSVNLSGKDVHRRTGNPKGCLLATWGAQILQLVLYPSHHLLLLVAA